MGPPLGGGPAPSHGFRIEWGLRPVQVEAVLLRDADVAERYATTEELGGLLLQW